MDALWPSKPRVTKAVDKDKVIAIFSVEADNLKRHVDGNIRKGTQLRVVVARGVIGALPTDSIVQNFAWTCLCHMSTFIYRRSSC